MTRITACIAVLGLAATAVACSNSPQAPASPNTSSPTAASANADGSTLKATSPTPQSPINGQQPQSLEIVLADPNASGKDMNGLAPTYRFQIFNAAGTLVYDAGNVAAGGAGVTAHTVTADLDGDQPYSWQARAEVGNNVGPWSARANFVAPASTGYIRGNELYDPLINGQTVGQLIGDVSWVPGVGIKLNSQLGYVQYQLPQDS